MYPCFFSSILLLLNSPQSLVQTPETRGQEAMGGDYRNETGLRYKAEMQPGKAS